MGYLSSNIYLVWHPPATTAKQGARHKEGTSINWLMDQSRINLKPQRSNIVSSQYNCKKVDQIETHARQPVCFGRVLLSISSLYLLESQASLFKINNTREVEEVYCLLCSASRLHVFILLTCWLCELLPTNNNIAQYPAHLFDSICILHYPPLPLIRGWASRWVFILDQAARHGAQQRISVSHQRKLLLQITLTIWPLTMANFSWLLPQILATANYCLR